MSLRQTKRYQYATEGVRGDGKSRRKWLSRLGFWRFDIQVEIVEYPDNLAPYTEPQRIQHLVRITVRYKEKSWIQQYIIPERAYSILVSARMRVSEIVESVIARFKRGEINTSDIRITVKRKEDK